MDAVAGILTDGLWHFTSLRYAKDILSAGCIRPSPRTGKWGDCYAAHIGAVALLDMSCAEGGEIDSQAVEYQRSNIFGFLGGFADGAIALRFCPELSAELVGPAGLDGFQVPTVSEGGHRYMPRCIPYFERWHVGTIPLDRVEAVHRWLIEERKVGLWRSKVWVHTGRHADLAASLAA